VQEVDMDRFDGTAARQVLLVDEAEHPIEWREAGARPRHNLRLLQKDVYAELARRRRRAQIAARHHLERHAHD
jgi:hypothetical protein